ncbi:hypothetical protein DRQ25_14035 [Candidatus Fermentibacteria bacterium]|nr:MAG: hypothetical protein DRQ25_14035 [Candidatus Fermentibacteria bacterium]
MNWEKLDDESNWSHAYMAVYGVAVGLSLGGVISAFREPADSLALSGILILAITTWATYAMIQLKKIKANRHKKKEVD